MSSAPSDGNMDRPITARQDDPAHHRRLLAYSHDYTIAARWRGLRVGGNVALASVPFATVTFGVDTPVVLGAVSAGYLVIARTALRSIEERAQQQAALVQERYDTSLFNVPWNSAVAGDPPSPDDVEASAEAFIASKRYRKQPIQYRRWYDVDLDGVPWPNDVLLCQRQSAVWSRMDHAAYATSLWIAFSVLTIAGMTFALVNSMSLSDALVLLFLPTAPAALDLIEKAQAHQREAAVRRSLERAIEREWIAAADGATVDVADLRRLQDASYLSRRTGPKVPQWFYELRRARRAVITALGSATLRRVD